ncbi:hypothetical protein BN7_5407 [Wickerhamomyces ciferrii]|uniref:Uncharacterized protein n=1 Tax=Wickerhamomyces ciferrii (strain ATCC 14091 / BCRC 22168 / CBS 111 / JCM 3599 / NBRC 0793 / NRRL Y-1031 F-60-10) TaxID=1206466 RepID=K0KRS9_WICCF|nr:uncharacterized protein BN7_5407 [Wickerhamomyces ciferrii]CCH45821.1 hypothetical protein BN7_5407 [Wickerhamomyces ciferrii]
MSDQDKKQLIKDREEYQDILNYLNHNQLTEVLSPLDGEGREFWVQAITNPNDSNPIKLDIGNGDFKEFNSNDAKKFLNTKIEQLNKKIGKVN